MLFSYWYLRTDCQFYWAQNSSFDSDNSDNLQTEVTQIENDDPRPAPINGSSTAAEKSSIFSQTPEASSEILVEKVSSEPSKYKTVPSKLDTKQLSQWDELDEILQVEREWKDHEKPYHTMPSAISSNQTSQVIQCLLIFKQFSLIKVKL